MPRRTDLALATPAQPLAQLVERAQAYTVDARASSTRKAYLTDFASFEAWCTRQSLPSSPATPAAVAVYLAALADAGRKASTIERALAGIAWAQRARGFEWQKAHPAISAVMTGIQRTHGTAPSQKAPVVDQELAALVATLDGSLRGLRDRALLTMGWFARPQQRIGRCGALGGESAFVSRVLRMLRHHEGGAQRPSLSSSSTWRMRPASKVPSGLPFTARMGMVRSRRAPGPIVGIGACGTE
jgi:hypothetical protein